MDDDDDDGLPYLMTSFGDEGMLLLPVSLCGERARRPFPRVMDSWVTVLLEPLEPFDFCVSDDRTETSDEVLCTVMTFDRADFLVRVVRVP